MKNLTCMCPNEIVMLASTFSMALAEGLDENEIIMLSTFLNSISDLLGMIATSREAIALQKQKCSANPSDSKQVQPELIEIGPFFEPFL